jgi:hypothetical protein
LRDYEATNASVLMKDSATAQKCSITDPNVAAKQTVVRHDNVISDLGIVCEVNSSHKKIPVPNSRNRPLSGTAMDGAMLADDVVITDFYSAVRRRFEG